MPRFSYRSDGGNKQVSIFFPSIYFFFFFSSFFLDLLCPSVHVVLSNMHSVRRSSTDWSVQAGSRDVCIAAVHMLCKSLTPDLHHLHGSSLHNTVNIKLLTTGSYSNSTSMLGEEDITSFLQPQPARRSVSAFRVNEMESWMQEALPSQHRTHMLVSLPKARKRAFPNRRAKRTGFGGKSRIPRGCHNYQVLVA